MPATGEHLHRIAEVLRAEITDAALVNSIIAYLDGSGPLEDVRVAWKTYHVGNTFHERLERFKPLSALFSAQFGEVYRLLPLAESQGALEELDLRYVAVNAVLHSYPEVLVWPRLTTTERKYQMLKFLHQNEFEPRVLLIGALGTLSHAFEQSGQLTPFGEYLLSYVPAAIDRLEAQDVARLQSSQWLYPGGFSGLIRLLLAATPPDPERAWAVLRRLDLKDTMFYVSLRQGITMLLQADPAHSTVWLRSLVQSGENPYVRLDAMELLMHHRPAALVEFAVEIVCSPLAPDSQIDVQLHTKALTTLYAVDPVAYFPLVEAAVLDRQQPMLAQAVVAELAKTITEQTRSLLQRCVTSGILLASQEALKALLLKPWEGMQTFMCTLVNHPFSSIRQSAWNWLAQQGEASLEPLILLLAAPKASTRLNAVQALRKITSERTTALLAARLKVEKSPKIQQAIALILDDLETSDHRSLAREEVLQRATWLHRYAPKPVLPWFNLEEAPTLRWTTGAPVPPVVLGYLLRCQSRQKQPGALDGYVRRALALIDQDTSGDLALALFTGWLENDARPKEAWLIPLACALGDARLVPRLQRAVENWRKGRQLKLSLYILQAMPLIEEAAVLDALKDLAKRLRRFKLKQAAKVALAATTVP